IGRHTICLIDWSSDVCSSDLEWAARRHQFGQPIGRFQGVGFQLADLATELEAAELLTLRAGVRLDQGTMTDSDAAMAKLYASEKIGRASGREGVGGRAAADAV